MALSAVELLAEHHRVEGFDCGKPALNAWLTGFAKSNQARDFTRVLVVHDAGMVVGYYGIAPTVLQAMPPPVPSAPAGRRIPFPAS